MSRLSGVLTFAAIALLLGGTLADEPAPKVEGGGKPPWQRLLQGEDDRKADQLQQQINRHWEAADFDAALKAAAELAALRRRLQGADHWEAVNAEWQRKAFQTIVKREAADQRAMAKVPALGREADNVRSQGR